MKKIVFFSLIVFIIIGVVIWNKNQTPTINETNSIPEVTLSPVPTASVTPSAPPKDLEEHQHAHEAPTHSQKTFETSSEILNAKWYPAIHQKLLAFHDEETKVFLEQDLNPYQLKKNEKVLIVTFLKNNGQSSSFRALIDTKNQEILRTWDQPHIEGEVGIETTPTGGI